MPAGWQAIEQLVGLAGSGRKPRKLWLPWSYRYQAKKRKDLDAKTRRRKETLKVGSKTAGDDVGRFPFIPLDENLSARPPGALDYRSFFIFLCAFASLRQIDLILGKNFGDDALRRVTSCPSVIATSC